MVCRSHSWPSRRSRSGGWDGIEKYPSCISFPFARAERGPRPRSGDGSARSRGGGAIGPGNPALDVVVEVLGTAQVDDDDVPRAVALDLARDPGMADRVGQDEPQRDPALHRAQLGERAGSLEEDPDRHGLDVDVAERLRVGQDGLEHRALVRRPGGEVLLEVHGRGALVALALPSEAPLARRAGPSGHERHDDSARRSTPGGAWCEAMDGTGRCGGEGSASDEPHASGGHGWPERAMSTASRAMGTTYGLGPCPCGTTTGSASTSKTSSNRTSRS